MLQICENIKQARERKGISQVQAAKILGEKRTTYANWEKNIEPDLQTIKRIAQMLEVPAFELLRGVIEFDPEKARSLEQEKEQRKISFLSLLINSEELEEIKHSLYILEKVLQRTTRVDELIEKPEPPFEQLLYKKFFSDPGNEPPKGK